MKYPLGIQTFAHIRQDNFTYVDKTELIHELISQGKSFFLSRPRRFGKSLLISTFESLFKGDKDLFEDLAIADTDYDFPVYPVIKLEFAKDEFATADNLRECIRFITNLSADKDNIKLSADNHNQRFEELVIQLHQKTGQKVVLLIDEYDKPILNNLTTPILDEIRQVLNAFYTVVKSIDEHLKFVFITGVSKFAKVSVFSGMNSLTDISMNKRYATICGITQQQLDEQFAAPINELAEIDQTTEHSLREKIKQWYNGYCFHQQAVGVYNPYSLLSLFYKQEFENFWFETGTPTFLLNLLQEKQYDLKNLTDLTVGKNSFAACEPENMSVQAIFLQTGYLTIKSFNDGAYTLGFPNLEVEQSFCESVAQRYSGLDAGLEQTYLMQLLKHLKTQNFEDFFETLSVFFANIPYEITLKNEKYYQSLFYAIFKLVGLNIEAEVKTNKGRIDCVIETQDMICIIEFKLHGSKEDALAQILKTEYSQKYQLSDKRKVLIGVEFDQVSRNIGGYICQ